MKQERVKSSMKALESAKTANIVCPLLCVGIQHFLEGLFSCIPGQQLENTEEAGAQMFTMCRFLREISQDALKARKTARILSFNHQLYAMATFAKWVSECPNQRARRHD